MLTYYKDPSKGKLSHLLLHNNVFIEQTNGSLTMCISLEFKSKKA
jgi:hypothetical protein